MFKKTNRKNLLHRLLSCILCVLLLVDAVPAYALASDTESALVEDSAVSGEEGGGEADEETKTSGETDNTDVQSVAVEEETVNNSTSSDEVTVVTDSQSEQAAETALMAESEESDGENKETALMSITVGEETTNYSTFEDGVAALANVSSGQTAEIKLLADISLSAVTTINMTGDLVLDLNGCKITADYSLKFGVNGTVTIKDSGSTGTIGFGASSNTWCAQKFIIESGTYTFGKNYYIQFSANKAYTSGSSMEVVISGGTFIANHTRKNAYGAVSFEGASADVIISATLADVTISSVGSKSSPAFSVGNYANVVVESGTFEGDGTSNAVIWNRAEINCSSTITIKGGTFTSTGSNGNVVGLYDTSFDSSVWIYGGKFNGNVTCSFDTATRDLMSSYMSTTYEGGVYVRGGSFNGTFTNVDTTGTKNETNDEYTVYTALEAMTATVSLVGSGAELDPVGKVVAYSGVAKTYTLKLYDDYELKSVIYQEGDGEEQDVLSALTLTDNLYTYTVTAETDYKLTFTVEEKQSTESVAAVTDSSGASKEYTNLTGALNALAPGSELKLLADATRIEPIVISTDGTVTLDLNGYTITTNSAASVMDDSLAAAISVQGGSLNLCDSSTEQTGCIVASGTGVALRGDSEIQVNIDGGTIQAKKYGVFSGPYAQNGEVTISGGTISADINAVLITSTNGELTITSGSIIGTGSRTSSESNAAVLFQGATLSISGGEIKSTDAALRLTGSRGNISITNGELYSSEGPGVYVYMQTGNTSISIGGTAKIVSAKDSAVYFHEIADQDLAISGNAVLEGTDFAVETQQNKTYTGNITGGHYKCDVLPIDYTIRITYPENMVMGVEPETSGEYAGYYTLVTKDSLAGKDENGLDQTYQNFDDLRSAISSAEALDSTLYTDLSYQAVTDALSVAREVLTNANANQKEIDYYTEPLVDAILNLVTNEAADLDNKPDGTYSVTVTLLNASDNGKLSMANGAIEHKATLILEDGVATLQFTLNPLQAAGMWGHTEKVWLYTGDSYTAARANMKSEDSELSELEAISWYTDKDDNGTTTSAEKGDDGAFPNTFSMELPYFNLDEYKFMLRISIDVMNQIGVGEQAVVLQLDYGTMQAISVHDTLSVSTTSVSIPTGGTQQLTAKVIGTSGWTITYTSSDESVATVSASGLITGVGAGEATITVTATKSGESLEAKTVKVSVESGDPIKAETETSGTTANSTISGDALVTTEETVDVETTEIDIDATSGDSIITDAKVTIEASAAQTLAEDGRSVAIKTDVGTITLDTALMQKIASAGDDVVLTIKEVEVSTLTDAGIDTTDITAVYEITLTCNGMEVAFGNGTATVTVPWDAKYGYAYYVENGALSEVYTMTVVSGYASWETDHFSTWALSEKGNLMDDVSIANGTYSVPITIKQANSPTVDSMANDAVGSYVIAEVTDTGVTYTFFLKARVGTELGDSPLRGHLLKMWHYEYDDTDRENPVADTIVRTYEDEGMDGEIGTFPREMSVTLEGDAESQFYIMVYVDAMGESYQDALVLLDWDNALADDGAKAREEFTDDLATEQTIDSGDTVTSETLKSWVQNSNTLLVQGEDEQLTASFDNDALSSIYDQAIGDVTFTLEKLSTTDLTDAQKEAIGSRPAYELALTSGSQTITQIADGTVKVTLPYSLKTNENKNSLVVYLVDEDGTLTKIESEYDSKTGELSFETTEFGVFAILYDSSILYAESGDEITRDTLKEWIDNDNSLVVEGTDDDLTAKFDPDALEDIYNQTEDEVTITIEKLDTSKLTDAQKEAIGDDTAYVLTVTSGDDTLTGVEKGIVTVTLPYKLGDGESADGLVVYLVGADGTVTELSCTYSEKGQYVSFETTQFGVFAVVYNAAEEDEDWNNPFTDVSKEDWFYEAVKYVVQNGLFVGTSDTTFEPNTTMTRGMLVTVLYRLEGEPIVSGTNEYSDVVDGAYYADAVLWATQNGIVNGYGDGTFGPSDPITREQMAKILYYYAEYKGYDVSMVKDLSSYTDSGEVSSWAVRPMQWAVANGIITGVTNTTLEPKSGATRAQVATIFMRFDEKFVKAE